MGYYLETFWEESGDERISSLPLMHGGPWTLILLAAAYFYAITVSLPERIRQSKASFDAKPWLIVYYGFMFGAHGVGTALSFAAVDLSTSWSCDALDTSPSDVRAMAVIYAAYVLFTVKIFHLVEPYLALVKSGGNTSQASEALGLLANIFLYRFAYKAAPGNAFLWIAVTEMVFCTFFYGYQALATASVEMLPDPKWKKVTAALRIAHLVSLFAHGLHLMSVVDCAMPRFVSFYECTYALLSMSVLALGYARQVVANTSVKSH